MIEMNSSNVRLLLVEDNPRMLEMIKRFMTRFGYTHIVEANTASQAKDLFDQGHFDVVVADMRMEAEDSGFAVIEEVRRRNLSSVVIIFTANETWLDCRRAFRHRVCWDYISKNIEGNPYEELHNSIQEAITYFNRWGNRNDEEWIAENQSFLVENYFGQFVAVINNSVIESAQTKEDLYLKLNERKLPQFLTVITKIEFNLLHGRPLLELIAAGESNVIEFKSTLSCDISTLKVADYISKQCLKTIAAFINSDGGTLIIGVEDNGNVIGLKHDYCFLGSKRDLRDVFENKLRDMISSNLGKMYASSEYTKIRFEVTNSLDVCIVDVNKSREPVFISPNKELYIRTGNSSRQLNMEEFYGWVVRRMK